MFELYCEDLIQNLWRKTGVLRESILRKMSQDHQVCNTAVHICCKRISMQVLELYYLLPIQTMLALRIFFTNLF